MKENWIQLAGEVRENRGRLREFLEGGRLPECLSMMFACDCAQRAYVRSFEEGHEALRGLLLLARDAIENRGLVGRVMELRELASESIKAMDLEASKMPLMEGGKDRLSSMTFAMESVLSASLGEAWDAADAAVWSATYAAAGRVLGRGGKIHEAYVLEVDEVRFAERRWQRERLAWLLEVYVWAGERMTFLIREGRIETPAVVFLEGVG